MSRHAFPLICIYRAALQAAVHTRTHKTIVIHGLERRGGFKPPNLTSRSHGCWNIDPHSAPRMCGPIAVPASFNRRM